MQVNWKLMQTIPTSDPVRVDYLQMLCLYKSSVWLVTTPSEEFFGQYYAAGGSIFLA